MNSQDNNDEGPIIPDFLTSHYKDKARKLRTDADVYFRLMNSPSMAPARAMRCCEDAIKSYRAAAYLYKNLNMVKEAGDIFHKTAYICESVEKYQESARCYAHSAECLRSLDPKKSIMLYHKAINILRNKERDWSAAARHSETVGQIYEMDLHELRNSIKHYKLATNFHNLSDKSPMEVRRCRLKVASLTAQLKQYDQAIEYYEQMAIEDMKCLLLKCYAKEHVMIAALCHLCSDTRKATLAMDNYEQFHPEFAVSKQARFIRSLMDHIKNRRLLSLTREVEAFESESRMDAPFGVLISRLKKAIKHNSNKRTRL